MEASDQNSLMNVVNHLKTCIGENPSKFDLNLQYKFAKPNQSVQGNKKFDQILKKSKQTTIVMNANRQVKTRQYVHLKSQTYPQEFKWFQKNIQTLEKLKKLETIKVQKMDLNANRQKITFDQQTSKWSYKSKKMLFRPNYQTVKNGKLFRIALISQAKGTYQPRKKVAQLIQYALNQFLHQSKAPQSKYQKVHPLRFKNQTTYILDEWIQIVTSQVYEVLDLKLYQKLLDWIKVKRNSSKQVIGKFFISQLIEEVLKEQQKLTYQVELRFNPQIIKEFEDMEEQLIQQKMNIALDIFTLLSLDPKQFSAEEVLALLQKLQNE